MKTVNEMKLCVPSKSCNEAFARCVVSAFVMSLDPTVNELSDLKTAVSEAVTNCIVHGYRHQSGTIYINGKITSENKKRRSMTKVTGRRKARYHPYSPHIPHINGALEPLTQVYAAGY